MKLPYRRGDSFELPLGNGASARSCIVHCEHRVVVIAVGDDPSAPVARLRTSDDALVFYRWKVDGHHRPTFEGEAENRLWISAARSERQAAARLGIAHPRERRSHVLEIRDDTAFPERIDDDTTLTIATALGEERLDALATLLTNHPGATLRLLSSSLKHLARIAPHVRRLSLGGAFESLPLLENLVELDVHAGGALAALAAAAPNLTRLTWRASGAFEPRALHAFARLQSLDLSGVTLQSDAFPALAHLRLSRTTGLRAIPALPSLHTLAIEHVHDLERVEEIAGSRALEQLELRGMWQFDIAHVEFALDLPRLVRAEIDIGGRRKNVELYRRAAWAYPWRFPGMIVP